MDGRIPPLRIEVPRLPQTKEVAAPGQGTDGVFLVVHLKVTRSYRILHQVLTRNLRHLTHSPRGLQHPQTQCWC